MFFTITLCISLLIFGLGLIYKISTWFRYKVGEQAQEITPIERVSAAFKGIILTLFSLKILILLQVFIMDVLLQVRVLREDPLRWVMHMCIYGGFMLLLLMHALDRFITAPLFPDYAATLNPFLFLRNLFFVVLIAGLGISFYRRFVLKVSRLNTNVMDHYAIIILALITLSGVFLEGTKIVSYNRYQSMVEEYADTDDEEELITLESYWVKVFGVVSPRLKGPFDQDALEQGKELHEMSCAGCHALPQWAFVSYGVSRIVKSVALGLDRAGVPTLLWYIHFLACFVGLAYLPFSKFLHIIVSPLNLLADAVVKPETSSPATIATKQAMELDACTRCKTCGLWCSVAASLEEIDNKDILPSERIETLKSIAAQKEIPHEEIEQIWAGSYKCTLCGRCTEVCPVGIGLKDLWKGMREDFVRDGHFPPILNVVQEAIANQHNPVDYDNEERAMWVEFLDDPPDDLYQKEQAEVVYFVGCVSSFSPAVQKIPEAFCQILTKANVDFTILGEKERCCGFPLLLAGIHKGVEELKEHNIKTIREMGAKTIVFSCPSCYHTWSHEYHKDIQDVRLMHATQFLEELIRRRQVDLTNSLTGTITYHDPCDLGRGSGEYDAPRRVIQRIPGLNFVELSENSRKALCCGGGGDVEMYDNALTARVAAKRAGQARDAGATLIATACQQCVRTLTSGVKGIEADIEVLDVIQLVWRSMAKEA
ncbi:MAG: (Fe-S)-binding protein [Desulfobacteraceae bacterium]|jgi:Fe-S oxidoreductase/nitrate reductase gamma subunit